MKGNLRERLTETFISYCEEHNGECQKCDGPCYREVPNPDKTIFEELRSLFEEMDEHYKEVNNEI